jgi:hypothetical protein
LGDPLPMRVVPSGVPSLFHSSMPPTPMNEWTGRNSVPSTSAGGQMSVPVRSLTADVPAAEPSVRRRMLFSPCRAANW